MSELFETFREIANTKAFLVQESYCKRLIAALLLVGCMFEGWPCYTHHLAHSSCRQIIQRKAGLSFLLLPIKSPFNFRAL
jgi:hypothetical protein